MTDRRDGFWRETHYRLYPRHTGISFGTHTDNFTDAGPCPGWNYEVLDQAGIMICSTS